MAGIVLIISQSVLWTKFLAEQQIFFYTELKILPPFEEKWPDFLFKLFLLLFLFFRAKTLDDPMLFCALAPGWLASIFNTAWWADPLFANNYSWYLPAILLVIVLYLLISSYREDGRRVESYIFFV